MGLFLPPAVSVNNFTGGFKANADYPDLKDTETKDSRNVLYTTGGDLEQKKGSLRLYNTSLKSSGGTEGRPITGHYYYEKLGSTGGNHVVAAGDSLFNYNSSTAVAIATGLTDDSNTFWSFIQIQDPRSAANDIAVGCNGVDAIRVWDGSGSSVLLSSFTSASGVPIAKFLLTHKNRIYAANILDTASIDSGVQVKRTEFGTDGVPNPHRFTQEFFVGGSSRDGQIQGQAILNDDIFYYLENAIWRFSPGLGDVNDLRKISDSIGLLAPRSLVDTGNFHIFLSQRGVYAFDGNSLVHLSQDIDDLLLNDTNRSQLQYAKAVFDDKNNQYKLFIPQSGSNRNNLELIYDIRPNMKFWQPPAISRSVSFASDYLDTNRERRVIVGDYFGYLYEDEVGTNYGIQTGINDTVGSASVNTLTADSATFSTTGDGLAGLLCRITDGLGEGQERYISSNTSAVLTLEQAWSVVPNSASTYSIGAIQSYWQSKDYDFVGHDIIKMFKSLLVRVSEEGDFALNLKYIFNFNSLARATLATIKLFDKGMVWGISKWGQATWGGAENIRKSVFFRSTSSQSVKATHAALRFSNERANEKWKLTGYDIVFKAIGKKQP